MKKYLPSYIFIAWLAVFLVLFALLPRKDYSSREKRVLSSFPSASYEDMVSGNWEEDVESWFSDHFPGREFFVGVNAYFNLICGLNTSESFILGSDGRIFARPADYDDGVFSRNMSAVSKFVENSGIPVSLIAVPEAGYMLQNDLPSNSPQYKDDYYLAKLNSSGADIIDITDALSDAGENAYYKTDHHLTASGAYVLYREYAAEMWREPADEDDFDKEIFQGFYGTAYSGSGLWLTGPDDIELWHSTGNYTVTISDSGIEDIVSDSLFFTSHLEEEDKYPVYLDGNHSLTHIRNDSAPERTLVIIKDSFAHCAATMLARDYSDIYMVDLRYYKLSVSELVRQVDADEALVLYGVANLTSDSSLAWLK